MLALSSQFVSKWSDIVSFYDSRNLAWKRLCGSPLFWYFQMWFSFSKKTWRILTHFKIYRLLFSQFNRDEYNSRESVSCGTPPV